MYDDEGNLMIPHQFGSTRERFPNLSYESSTSNDELTSGGFTGLSSVSNSEDSESTSVGSTNLSTAQGSTDTDD